MKRFGSAVVFGLALLDSSPASAAPSSDPEPVPASAVSSTVRNVSEPRCLDGREVQIRKLIVTYKDATGATTDVEQADWQEETGKPCKETATRGPLHEKVTGVQLESEARAGKVKTRQARPCECFRRYFWWGRCLYVRHFDCDFNFCYSSGPIWCF